jgi:hypothetical protein
VGDTEDFLCNTDGWWVENYDVDKVSNMPILSTAGVVTQHAPMQHHRHFTLKQRPGRVEHLPFTQRDGEG